MLNSKTLAKAVDKPGKKEQDLSNDNEEWHTPPPPSLTRDISPPPKSSKRFSSSPQPTNPSAHTSSTKPNLAAIEAGRIQIENHLEYFSAHLKRFTKPAIPSQPRISIEKFVNLYKRNQHPRGRHFVVHQHDHPIAGVHYDLRIQISETSSISFAMMYGLPGNPQSRNVRYATETRVHNLWNHLLETASHATGSLLIWDIGEYSVLPRHPTQQTPETDDEDLSPDSSAPTSSDNKPNKPTKSEPEKLHDSFAQRHIRLRLHGVRLPRGYTITLRLPPENDRVEQPRRPPTKRRKKDIPPDAAPKNGKTSVTPSSSTDSDDSEGPVRTAAATPRNGQMQESSQARVEDGAGSTPYEKELQELEDETIRLTNAYPGAVNSIGSIHQRKWFLSLDRANSGFVQVKDKRSGRVTWSRRRNMNRAHDGRRKSSGEDDGGDDGLGSKEEQQDEEDEPGGFDPFFVRGRDHERSVVTGRLARDIMADEGVEGYVGRLRWKGILE